MRTILPALQSSQAYGPTSPPFAACSCLALSCCSRQIRTTLARIHVIYHDQNTHLLQGSENNTLRIRHFGSAALITLAPTSSVIRSWTVSNHHKRQLSEPQTENRITNNDRRIFFSSLPISGWPAVATFVYPLGVNFSLSPDLSPEQCATGWRTSADYGRGGDRYWIALTNCRGKGPLTCFLCYSRVVGTHPV
jgi:hypothetical protein